MSQPEQWELQFEHIDWNDIVDAELDGDTQALEELKEKSLELKQSFSCPSPTTPLESESPLRQTPPHHFKIPHYPSRSKRRTSKQRKPRPQHSHPYQHLEQDYPSLPASNVHDSPHITSSPHAPFSYALAAQSRAGKRPATERLCLSPIDHVPKRHALQLTPREPRLYQLNGTPQDRFTDEVMEVCDPNECTPGGESHPSMAMVAAQRRLFSPAKENTSPKSRTEHNSSVSELSLHQLNQRQKQIDFGKNTLGYQRYLQTVPKWQRKRSDPMTPDKSKLCSTRAWQGQVKVWRRALHNYDPPKAEGVTQFTLKEALLCEMDTPTSLVEA